MPDTFLVLYPEDFAEPKPRAAPPPAAVEPGFSAADIAAARAEGYASGEAAGRAAAAADRHTHLAEALARLAERLAAAEDAATAAVEMRALALAQVMRDALAAAFPSLTRLHGAAEMRGVIAAVMPALSREASVTMHVPPDLLEAARAALDGLNLRRAAPPRIVADDRLRPGDIEIAWDDGRAVRDGAAIWREVVAALAPLGLPADTTPPPDPTE